MDERAIAERIRVFLESEFPDQGKRLTVSTPLLEDFFLDSFGIIDTVMFLENEFGIRISRADVNGETFASIETLARFVRGRLPSS